MGIYKIKVVWYVPNSYLVRLETLYPDHGVWGEPKGCPVGFCSLSSTFWWKLYQTKVAGHPQFCGGRSPFRTPNLDLEGPGPSVLLEPWSFNFKGNLEHESCSVGSKWVLSMSGYPNMLKLLIITYISIILLKPHLNHPGQCWVTTASQ